MPLSKIRSNLTPEQIERLKTLTPTETFKKLSTGQRLSPTGETVQQTSATTLTPTSGGGLVWIAKEKETESILDKGAVVSEPKIEPTVSHEEKPTTTVITEPETAKAQIESKPSESLIVSPTTIRMERAMKQARFEGFMQQRMVFPPKGAIETKPTSLWWLLLLLIAIVIITLMGD